MPGARMLRVLGNTRQHVNVIKSITSMPVDALLGLLMVEAVPVPPGSLRAPEIKTGERHMLA